MSHPYDRIAEEPGGMECEECNVIFIGAEWHRICAVCAGINEPPEPCPACGGPKSIRNPTGKCDHLYWPDNLTPEAKRKVEQAEALFRATRQR